MLVKESNAAQGADGLNEHETYFVRWRIPADESGKAWAEGSFKAKFRGVSLGAGNQLFAHFEGEDSIDVRFIMFPVYMA